MLTAVFAVIGVGVSVGIIAANGGFSNPRILDPPTKDDIWVVGSNIQNGTFLEYSLDTKGEAGSLVDSTVTMRFVDAGDDWSVAFTIRNGTGGEISRDITMSKELTRKGPLDEDFAPYFELVRESILAVRDMEYGDSPKYLVVGAPWNTIFVGASETVVRVTGQENVQTGAGSFDSFVLSYELNDATSRIWMVATMPLPVKAETFDGSDNPLYKFELLRASGVGPGGESL